MHAAPQRILVTGASGFVGRSLIPRLLRDNHTVRAVTRDLTHVQGDLRIDWMQSDLSKPEEAGAALSDIDVAYFLVHDMGKGAHDYRAAERHLATTFAQAAARAHVKRIIYLGGVAPQGKPSEHLASRLEVGEILRKGEVPTLELRASMIIGNGSASWKVIRDLALRLPAMVLPSWTESRTAPIALDDVLIALVRGLDIALPASAWFDIPGPDVVTGREMLLKVAALKNRRIPHVKVPLVSPSLSSWWLKLVTGADFSLARELVLGFETDLLPVDRRYWDLIGHTPKLSFDEAALKALEAERMPPGALGLFGKLEEALIQRFGARAR